MSQLQPVWTSGDYCKVSFKSKDVALSLTNLCVHKTEIQLTTQGCARIYNIKVRECPEPVKAVKCQVCGGEGHRENRYMPLCQNAYTRYDVQKLLEGGVCIPTFDP